MDFLRFKKIASTEIFVRERKTYNMEISKLRSKFIMDAFTLSVNPRANKRQITTRYSHL